MFYRSKLSANELPCCTVKHIMTYLNVFFILALLAVKVNLPKLKTTSNVTECRSNRMAVIYFLKRISSSVKGNGHQPVNGVVHHKRKSEVSSITL